jgi:hypothetical protein
MATKPEITLSYYTPAITPFAQLSPSYITSVSWSSGRLNITDQWSGSTCLITGINPTYIADKFQLGNKVRVTVKTTGMTTSAVFYGYISDYRAIYGVLPAYDTWELTIESGYAKLGRGSGTVTTTAGTSTSVMADSISTAGGVSNVVERYGPWGSTTSAQTITGQLTGPVNTLMATEQGTVIDSGQSPAVYPASFYPVIGLYGRNATDLYTNVAYFGDDGGGQYPYTEIEFLSSAQNYGTKVTVQADGFADQSSGSGDYIQTISTINSSTSEAANVAGYVKAQLDFAGTVPYSITTTGAAVGTLKEAILLADPTKVHQQITVLFRGTTYNCIIEGLSFYANPTDWRINLYLSSSLQNAFLRLNNATLGQLDLNRLGF